MMTWIRQNKRVWRAVLPTLMVVSFFGPWAISDRIDVPAQYECNWPYIRLEGDFCGWVQPGVRVFLLLAGAVFSAGGRLLAGEARAARELLVAVILLLPFVPVAVTLFAFLRGMERRPWWWPVTWLLGAAVALYFLAGFGPQGVSYAWGAWLFALLALVMVVGEGVALVTERTAAA